MSVQKITNILATKKPKDRDNKIIFLNPIETIKYYNDFLEYSLEEDFYNFMESSIANKQKIKNYFNNILKKYVSKSSKNISQKFWFVKSLESNKVIGSAKLCDFSIERNSVQWGYGIGSRYRKNNYLIHIQLSLIDYVFQTLNFNRLWGQTFEKNIRVINSQKLLKFRDEGVKYEFYYNKTKKKYYNGYAYSFLRKDYNKFFKKNKKAIKFNYKPKIKNDTKIIKEINKTICNTLNIKNIFKDNIQMKDVSNWDSLNHFNIISTIEKKYKKKFNSDQLIKMNSTFQILKAIKN